MFGRSEKISMRRKVIKFYAFDVSNPNGKLILGHLRSREMIMERDVSVVWKDISMSYCVNLDSWLSYTADN